MTWFLLGLSCMANVVLFFAWLAEARKNDEGDSQ